MDRFKTQSQDKRERETAFPLPSSGTLRPAFSFCWLALCLSVFLLSPPLSLSSLALLALSLLSLAVFSLSDEIPFAFLFPCYLSLVYLYVNRYAVSIFSSPSFSLSLSLSSHLVFLLSQVLFSLCQARFSHVSGGDSSSSIGRS
jgi:hypothetical protein